MLTDPSHDQTIEARHVKLAGVIHDTDSTLQKAWQRKGEVKTEEGQWEHAIDGLTLVYEISQHGAARDALRQRGTEPPTLAPRGTATEGDSTKFRQDRWWLVFEVIWQKAASAPLKSVLFRD